MGRSATIDKVSLFRKSIALNNIGTSLLARQRFRDAGITFEDSLRVMQLILDESLSTTVKEKEDNYQMGNVQAEGGSTMVFSPKEEESRAVSPKLEDDSEESSVLLEGKREFVSVSVESFSSRALHDAQQRLCDCTYSDFRMSPIPSFSNVLYKRQKTETNEVGTLLYSKTSSFKRGDDDAERNCGRPRNRDNGTRRGCDSIVPIDCSYYYAEGQGLFKDNVRNRNSQVDVSTVANEKTPAFTKGCDPPSENSTAFERTCIPCDESTQKDDVETCLYPVWIESMSHRPTFDHPCKSHPQVDGGNGYLGKRKEGSDSMVDDEIHITTAIITYNLSIAFQSLAYQAKKRSAPPSKASCDQSTETVHSRYSGAAFRTADLVVEILDKVCVESESEMSHLHTTATLRFLVFQFKEKACCIAGRNDEANWCNQHVKYYREILAHMEIVFNGNGRISAAA